ncbi:PAS-domain containing protein [uncultured Roseovarius sp.]|uniref:PAS-domain containing protein n=1 Tax=uncultured Roseovarius sp. TaxID=293344 RepID=UPI0026147438|nr:PAS-domain containing protein [uncultured Roseovarius sp.]
MDGNLIMSLAGLLTVSVMAAITVLWVSGILIGIRQKPKTALPSEPVSENTILFKNGVLADHDYNAAEILTGFEDWTDLRNWLGTRFEGLPEYLPDDTTSTQSYSATNRAEDNASVKITSDAGITRVILTDPVPCQPGERHQALHLKTAFIEDHAALKGAPYPIWKTDKEGQIVWQNDVCEQVLLKQLDKILDGIDAPIEPGTRANARIAIAHPLGEAQTWFDVHTTATDQLLFYYAIDVTDAVHAEAAQREFVQTLTKTFANLTTGLAIFDRNQQLALFNPALVDLTALPAEFLSGRPSLMSFFDNLRDRQVMPEPKSYAEWRTQISEMIETASDGLYQETWSLPSGVTYRVTGRPHPDGAVAFLFEDITAEISLTRRFRTQNDLRQSVMDKLDHAVAVIASNNVVIFCNATWTDMFGVDPDTSFAELGIRDLVAICRQKFPHPEFWKTVETQTTCKTLSHSIEETIDTKSGEQLHCRLVPVAGGAALICRPVGLKVENPKIETVIS